MLNRRLYAIRGAAYLASKKGAKGDLFEFLPGYGGRGFDWGSLFDIGRQILYRVMPSGQGEPAPEYPHTFAQVPAVPVPSQPPATIPRYPTIPWPSSPMPQLPPIQIGPGKKKPPAKGEKTYRRIDYCNKKALLRAIRRMKGFRHIAHDIESHLPKVHVAHKCPCKKR
jgi:hypothetical protein